MSRSSRVLLAVLTTLPVAVLSIRSLTLDAHDLMSPCVSWGTGESGSGVEIGDPCTERE